MSEADVETTRNASEQPEQQEQQQQQQEQEPEQDPYALLGSMHPILANVSKATFSEYIPFFTAWHRTREIGREDAIIADPYADKICKDGAAALLEFFPSVPMTPELTNYIILRSYFMEEALKNRPSELRQVVMLGSALETMPFRMEELRGSAVFEIQVNRDVMNQKERVLEEEGAELIARSREVILTKLSDNEWPDLLLRHGFDPKQPTFWLIEGIFLYLDPETQALVLDGVDRLSAPGSQATLEMILGGGLDLEMNEDNDVEMVVHSELQYGADGGVFRDFKWNVDLLARRNQAGVYYGSRWVPETLNRLRVPPEDASMGPWFVPLFTKPAMSS